MHWNMILAVTSTTLVVGMLLIVLWKLTRIGFWLLQVFHELLLIWSLPRNEQKNLRIYIYETKNMDEVSLSELINFGSDFHEWSHELNKAEIIQYFNSVIRSYKYVQLCRDRMDGSLQGVLLIDTETRECEGKKYTIMKIGGGRMAKSYRGGPSLKFLYVYLCLREKILHPFTPLYTVGKCSNYRGYLFATIYREFYPCYDKKTPTFYQAIIDDYANSSKLAHETYNPETCVLVRELIKLKSDDMTVNPESLENPHIIFFLKQNPGYLKGHCLITVSRTNWLDIFDALTFTFGRARRLT